MQKNGRIERSKLRDLIESVVDCKGQDVEDMQEMDKVRDEIMKNT